MYRIDFDKTTRILHLRLEGFWSLTTLASFTAELLARTTTLNILRIKFSILSDSTAFPIQSSSVAQGFETIMQKGAQNHQGLTAIIVAGQLNKMQAERTLKGERVRVFLVEKDAKQWLIDEMSRES